MRLSVRRSAAGFGLAALVLLLGSGQVQAVTQVTIGGFTGGATAASGRGGLLGFAEGTDMAGLRDAITSMAPLGYSFTFTSAGTLESSYFETVDVVILGAARGGNSAIAPLTDAEKSALRTFVNNGGAVFVVTDNHTFAGTPTSDLANDSLLTPFGMGSALATVRGDVTIDRVATQSSHPVWAGPFGTVSSAAVAWSGYFDNAGNGSTVIGRISGNLDPSGYIGNMPALVAWADGALATSSGRAVMASDSAVATNMSANSVLARNIMAYLMPAPDPTVAPEPSSLCLAALAAAAAGAAGRLAR